MRRWSIFNAASSNCRTGFSEVAVLTIGANGVETLPIRSVWLKTKLRSDGRVVSYFARARWMISPIFTSDGQATSQRLQLMQYFSASSYSAPSFKRRRSPSGPACFGPGYPGFTRLTGQAVVQTVHLMQFSKLVSFIVGLLRVGQSVERHVKH